MVVAFRSTPRGIRTPDTQFRRLVLYPLSYGRVCSKFSTSRRNFACAAVAYDLVRLPVRDGIGTQRIFGVDPTLARERHQFGRPIGSFQAIKHKCAEMLLSLETARSAAYYAARAAAEDSAELPAVASLAKAHCAEAFFHCAAENLQIHGGIAFTWEHDAHLYLKRAKSSDLLLGDATYHRELLLQRIGI